MRTFSHTLLFWIYAKVGKVIYMFSGLRPFKVFIYRAQSRNSDPEIEKKYRYGFLWEL